MIIHRYPSPNHNDRRIVPGGGPTFIIIHYTECDLGTALALLTDHHAQNPVSAHYVIAEDGTLFQLVDEERRAWHAGISYWQGITDMNSHSIGIELVNDGAAPFHDEQIKSLITLCHDICLRRQIPGHHILGHSHIAPGRKKDPGPLFPWHVMTENGLGPAD